MIRIYLIILIFLIFGQPSFAADYWVYVATSDRVSSDREDNKGLYKDGDIVDTVPADGTNIPSQRVKDEYLIFKADLTRQQASQIQLNWTDRSVRFVDGEPINERDIIADKRYKLDYKSVTSQNRGVVSERLDSIDFMNHVVHKDETDLARYEKLRRVEFVRNIGRGIEGFFGVRRATAQTAGTYTVNKPGEDYASMELCESSQNGNFSGVGVVTCEMYSDDGILVDDWQINGSSGIDGRGGSDRFIFTCAPEDRVTSPKVNTGKCLIQEESDNPTVLINDANVEVNWLQIQHGGTSAGQIALQLSDTGLEAHHIIIDGADGNIGGIDATTGTGVVWYAVMFDCDKAHFGGWRGSSTCNFCVSYHNDGTNAEGFRDGTCNNCIVTDNYDDWDGSGGNYNAGDSGESAPGANSITVAAADVFTNLTAGSEDFSVKGAGAGTVNTGTDPGSPYSDGDFKGEPCDATCDMGVDQLVTVSSLTHIEQIMTY